MTDIFTKKKRSQIMSLIKGKNTELEKIVFRYLRHEGIYFRKHHKTVLGRPDVCIPSKKKAVFIDSDFWHGWKFSEWRWRLSSDFWKEKIASNIRRDKRNFSKLRRNGWKVLRVWGHDLSTKVKREKTLRRIRKFLQAR